MQTARACFHRLHELAILVLESLSGWHLRADVVLDGGRLSVVDSEELMTFVFRLELSGQRLDKRGLAYGSRAFEQYRLIAQVRVVKLLHVNFP